MHLKFLFAAILLTALMFIENGEANGDVLKNQYLGILNGGGGEGATTNNNNNNNGNYKGWYNVTGGKIGATTIV